MRLWAPIATVVGLLAAASVGTHANAAPNSATARPAAAASAPAHQLKEIGRVKALSPLCSALVEHADSAIITALENDARLAFTISNLHTIDLDSSAVKKANGTRSLLSQYTALRAAAVTGEGQVKTLQADVASSDDPQRKADVKAFADALAGALERQKKMADQLARYIAYADSHASLDKDAQAQYLFDIQWAQGLPGSPYYGNPQDWVPPSLSDVAKSAANQLSEEASAVADDEGVAAGRVEPAFKGCL